MKKTKLIILLALLLQCSFAVAQSYTKVFDYRPNVQKVLDEALTTQAIMMEELESARLLRNNEQELKKNLRNVNTIIVDKFLNLSLQTVYILQKIISIKDEPDRYAEELDKLQEFNDELERFAQMDNNMSKEEAEYVKREIAAHKDIITCGEDLLAQVEGLTGNNLLNKMQFVRKKDKNEYCNEISAILFDRIEQSIKKNYVLTDEDKELAKKYYSIAEYYRHIEIEDTIKFSKKFQRSLSLFDYATGRITYSYIGTPSSIKSNELFKRIEKNYVTYYETPDFDFLYIDFYYDLWGDQYDKKLESFEVNLYRGAFNKLRELDEKRLKASPAIQLINERLLAGYLTNLFDIPSKVLKEAQKTKNADLLYEYMR